MNSSASSLTVISMLSLFEYITRSLLLSIAEINNLLLLIEFSTCQIFEIIHAAF